MRIIETKNEIKKFVGANVPTDAPKVSIITPAYNVAEYIAETLDSVFAQTFTDFEIIVVNDGSPDTADFERILKSYADKIVYLKQPNAGAGRARNTAIEHARGELLAFLDGDDVWHEDFLASQIEFLETGDFDLVYADALLFGGSPLDGQKFSQNAPSKGAANFESLLDLRCNVITSGVLCRKRNVLKAGKFEPEKVRAHDFVLWLKMARRGARIGYQKRVLLNYRVRLDSLSGDSVQRVKREIDVFERVRKQIELDETHEKIVEKQLERLNAEIEIERGKSFLLRKDFAAARKSFEKANRYRRSGRLQTIIVLLKIAPRFFLKFYESRRRAEIAFVPKNSRSVD